ncbi:MAG TPA: hypothetical protein VI485_14315 [Vicinamibacterales bacterium]|nr:hypothetical protein [Vicinamibacterales bacterium]
MAIDINTLARLGAAARVQQLLQEIAELKKKFPSLAKGGGGSRAAKATDGGAVNSNRKRRKRFEMTAAQKKAVSVRMRKYWAGRRAQKAKAAAR